MRMIPLSVALVALFAVPAVAQPAPAQSQLLQSLDFTAADADGDGHVSPAEWDAYLALVQAERSEAIAAHRAEMQALRGQMRELRAQGREMFGEQPGHGAEMRGQMRRDMRGMRAEMRDGTRPGQRGDARPGARMTDAQRAAWLDAAFARLDADGDGQISRDEFDAAAQERVARMRDHAERGERGAPRRGWRP